MKKLYRVFTAVVLILSFLMCPAAAAVSAVPTSSSVLVNGTAVSFEAYNIAGYNYFKLRDLAKVLSGSAKQFEVGWDAVNNAISLSTGRAYTPVGGELTASGKTGVQSAVLSTARVYIDGAYKQLTAYNIAGYNYFKLRDVGAAINFGVGWNAAASIISIDTSTGYSPIIKSLVVHYLDVGQADSIFIELPNGETMLIDAGNAEDGPGIVSYIKSLGYTKINYLLATHPHADHIGGMAYVVNNLAIGSVYMPKVSTTTQTFLGLLTAIQNKGLTITTARAGVSLLDIDSLKAALLAPNSTQYDDLNNYSAVLKLTFKNNTFLFMGDAEELSENEITADVSADVLKVGHHGSTSSTGTAFLSKVHPRYAVISVGADNTYGHPAQTTLDKLAAAGVTVYRTDKDGLVTFTSDGTTITPGKSPAPAATGGTSTGSTSGTASTGTYKVVISSVNKVGELVTLKNTGSGDVNLAGWVLVSVTGNQRYTFPSYVLKAGGTVTVASGSASGNLKWTTANVWNNDASDPAQLYDSAGNLISSYGG